MSYWVYVDDATNQARVHLGTCRFCNDGKGVREARLSDNRWHGSFEDKASANDKALRTGKRDVGECKVCLG